jgi:hypothetical protein
LQPDDAHAGQRAGAAQDLRGQRDVRPELVLTQAGGDVGVRAGVDVGVDAQGHPRGLPARGRRRADARDLRLALGVERAHALLDPQGQLRVGLPHPREHDAVGREAGGERGPHLHPGDDVGARAQAREHAEEGARSVGLEGVADAMGHEGKRPVVGRVGLLDHGPAVDVERRAVAGGRVIERHAVADERRAAPFETGHERKV